MAGHVFTLKQLEALVWVADLGGFRKAAQHLNTTQPNISARIAGLEKTLGVSLMSRDSGAIRLTDRGAQVLEAARKVLRCADQLVDTAQRPDLITDRLRLGVTELVACTWLRRYLRQLKEVYPGVSVELTVDLSHSLDTALGNHALDLTIQTAPFTTPTTHEIDLGQYGYAWLADAKLADRLSGKIKVADLVALNLLTHARHTQAFIELSQHAKENGLKTSQFVSSNSLSSCLQMAIDGLGIALLPEAMARHEIKIGRLMILNVDWVSSPLRFAARYHADKGPRFVEQAAKIAAEISTEFRKTDNTLMWPALYSK